MANFSLNELKLIPESRGIKAYKSMSEDRLLSALSASESTRGKNHDVEKANINETIREIRKEDRSEYRILRDLRFLFDPEKTIR